MLIAIFEIVLYFFKAFLKSCCECSYLKLEVSLKTDLELSQFGYTLVYLRFVDIFIYVLRLRERPRSIIFYLKIWASA